MFLNLTLFGIVAFGLCFYFIPFTIRIANKFNIHDHPDERKKHARKVPFMGGISFMMAYSVSLALCWTQSFTRPDNYHFIFISLLMLAFIGLTDDLLNFNPGKKLILQLLASSLLIYKGDFYLPFDQIFTSFHLPGLLSFLLTLLFIVGITNAYNLIDGSDGLSASIGIIISIAYGILFFTGSQYFYSAMSVCITGALIGFFLYNKPPAHIFMGDGGSLFLGMLFSIFSIYFIRNGGGFTNYSVNSRIILAFSLLAVPLLDMFRLFGLRIYQHKNPFHADNNHIHHLLGKLGYTPIQVLLWVLLLQLFIIGVALLTGTASWLGFVLVSICLYGVAIQAIRQLITYKNRLEIFKENEFKIREQNEMILKVKNST